MTTRRFVDAGGVRLAYVDTGPSHAPPVLGLHGFTGSADTMADLAARLVPSHRVILPDLIGHGSSDAPVDPAAYTFDACVAQLVSLVDELAVTRFDLLGYSMGGRVALGMATRHGDRVSSAVLIGASAGIDDPVARAERCARDAALADSIEHEGVPAFVDRWMALPLFASQRRLGREYLDAARRQRLANSPTGLANSLRGMGSGAQPPLHAELARIRTPIRLVVGAEDPKFRIIAAELAAALPSAELIEVAQAGHAAHLEQPAIVADAALELFASVDR